MKFVGKTFSGIAVLKTLGFVIVAGSLLAGCAKPIPQDGVTSKVMRFDDLRAMRYCEVFLIGGNPITKDLEAAFYNTTALNNTDPRDTCPADMWDKVDAKALKKEYDVLGVFKNGPRYWSNDWIDLPVGAQKSFDGLQARWFGQVKLPKGFGKGSVAYKPTTVARKSKMGFKKGSPVFILESPDGMPWVMQAYSLIKDPKLTYEDLKTLDKKLKLPEGWKYRVKVLEQDLEIHAIDGLARIVQDDLENTYDACFETDNQKSCTIKP